MARSETERALATTIGMLAAENKKLREKFEKRLECAQHILRHILENDDMISEAAVELTYIDDVLAALDEGEI